jgi:predicted component of type VI protein secretion system
MNSQTLFTDSFNKSDLMNVSLKINKLRNLIDGHLISIDSDFGNIIDDINDDEKTVDNIIDSVINSVSENNQSSYLDDTETEQISETSDKNSFSVDMNITSDISNFLNTETETSYTPTNYKNKIKNIKLVIKLT